ncbi:hypothetical protein Lalb_Chr19g0127321 [Lupinus albus]|uniref:Uncharacterized protein n=1 Tax=Lupinus albus TaxID=3870 RepID=A0A6A4NY48_LUPAL|nr:hypothetical protein Lalb_Chr19g0127321 [Lupinus albus]
MPLNKSLLLLFKLLEMLQSTNHIFLQYPYTINHFVKESQMILYISIFPFTYIHCQLNTLQQTLTFINHFQVLKYTIIISLVTTMFFFL